MAYTVSEEWREKCYSGESLYDCRLYIGETLVPTEQIANIKISSPIIDNTSENSNSFYVGSFISQKITIKFNNLSDLDQEIVSNIKSGNDVSLYIGQYTDDVEPHTTYEEIPIGKYIIDELGENYYKNWELVCLDYAIKFAQNLDYSGALHDGSIKVDELLEWICDYYGVTLGSYPTTNGDVLVGSYDNTQSGKYYISCIAEIKGCNAKIDRNGALNLIPIKTPPVVTIDATEGAEWELGEKYEVSKVTYYDAVRNYTFGDDSENTLFIRQDNPFVVDDNVVLNIYNSICGEQDTTQVSGTEISIDDTVEGPVTLELKPNTSQFTTTGKNILPQNKYVSSKTVNGITYTNNGDGTFNLVGTATANTSIQIISQNDIELEANQPYYLYSSVPYNSTTFNMSIPMTDNGTTKYLLANGTYTPTATPTNERLQFYLASGNSVNQKNIKMMLVKGTTAPSEYEPYTNGASPNPTYQQKVQNVSGDNVIQNINRNLLPNTLETQTYKGLTFTHNEDGSITINGTSTQGNQVNLCKAGEIKLDVGTYTMSSGNTIPSSTWLTLRENNRDHTSMTNLNQKQITITKPTVDAYIYFYFNNNVTINNLTIYPMLEKGNQHQEYEPHQEQNYPLNLGVKNIVDFVNPTGTLKCSYNSETKTYTTDAFTGDWQGFNIWAGNTPLTIEKNTTDFYFSADVRLVSGTYTAGNINLFRDGASITNVTNYITPILNPTLSSEFQRYVFKATYTNLSGETKTSSNFYMQLKTGASNVVLEARNLMVSKDKSVNYYEYGTEPIEYCAIGDYKDKFFKTRGKNLFRIVPQTVNGVTLSYDEDGAIVLNGTSTGWSAIRTEVDYNGAYTLSVNNNTTQSNTYIRTRNSSDTIIHSIQLNTTGNKSATSNSAFTKLEITIGTSNITYNNFKIYVQLEEGNQATQFEPYGSNNEWWIEKNTNKITINGSESWGYYGNYFYLQRDDVVWVYAGYKQYALSDYFENGYTTLNNLQFRLVNQNANGITEINLRNDSYNRTTLNDFKVWLSTLNAKFYYPLKTPTYIKIEGELAEQLDDIYNNMRTQLGQTNIIQDNNDLPFNIDINSYFTQDRFLIYSLKHRNYGDLSLDAWDIVNYDVDGTSYPTLNDNTTTYEMTVMSDVQVSIPTAQQEATTNVIGGTQSQKIKRVSTTVDNLSGQITLNAEEIDGLQENVGKLQIQADNISSTVKGTKADVQKLQSDITQKADSVTFNIYKERLDNIEENGVSKVDSTMVKIDETGLSVATNTSKITTTMTNNEFRVVANDDPSNPTKLAFIGYDENEHTSKSEMDNLTVKQYFVAGVHRTEALDLTDPATGNTEKRTSVFYTG